MKKLLLPFLAILFVSRTLLAQTAVEAFNVSLLAGRSIAPIIVDGVGEAARFEAIQGMWGDATNLYVADSMAIRRVELATGRVTTLSRTAGSGIHLRAAASGFQYDYSGLNRLWSDGSTLYANDIGEGSVRRIDLQTGGVQTIANGVNVAWG